MSHRGREYRRRARIVKLGLLSFFSLALGCTDTGEIPPTGPKIRASLFPDTAVLGTDDQYACDFVGCEELTPGEADVIYYALLYADWNLLSGDCILMRNSLIARSQEGMIYKFPNANDSTHSGYAGMMAGTLFVNDRFLAPESVKWVLGHESAHDDLSIGLEDDYWATARGVPSTYDYAATEKADECLN